MRDIFFWCYQRHGKHKFAEEIAKEIINEDFDLYERYRQQWSAMDEVAALREFARLRNRREWQWRRLWLTTGHAYRRIPSLDLVYHRKKYLRERRYAWQR